MPRERRTDRVERLESLKLLLAEREYATAGELADDLGVSLRTVHRDLATLRDLGVPVAGVTGRGGGVHLERGWSLGRVHLNESEAMGLLLSLAIARQIHSPLLLEDLRSIERKVVNAFAPRQAARISDLRRRVHLGEPATDSILADASVPGAEVTGPVLEAFVGRRRLDLRYRDAAGATSERSVEVHHLYYRLPIWYALTWDHLRSDIRAFRVDRITAAAVSADTFRVRPVEPFLHTVDGTTRHL